MTGLGLDSGEVFELPWATLTLDLVEQRVEGVERRPVCLDIFETFKEGRAISSSRR